MQLFIQMVYARDCNLNDNGVIHPEIICEACIGGTKYPISLEVNRQISLINWQISP